MRIGEACGEDCAESESPRVAVWPSMLVTYSGLVAGLVIIEAITCGMLSAAAGEGMLSLLRQTECKSALGGRGLADDRNSTGRQKQLAAVLREIHVSSPPLLGWPAQSQHRFYPRQHATDQTSLAASLRLLPSRPLLVTNVNVVLLGNFQNFSQWRATSNAGRHRHRCVRTCWSARQTQSFVSIVASLDLNCNTRSDPLATRAVLKACSL
eukprot:3684410-Amphidinium_carterae.1